MSTEEFDPEKISPTFCILPWIHMSTRPNGHMRVCCTANLNHTDLLSGWNNLYMKTVRKQMLNGEVPASCSKCFKEESAGHRSKRNWETEYWARRVDPMIGKFDT